MDSRTWTLTRVARRLEELLRRADSDEEESELRELVERILFRNDLWHGNTDPEWNRRNFVANVIEGNPELWEAVGYLRWREVYELVEDVEELILSIIPVQRDL
jgi:hypothetical protein